MRWLLLIGLLFPAACDYCERIDPLNRNGECVGDEYTDPPVQYEVDGALVRFDTQGPSAECFVRALEVVETETHRLTKKSLRKALDGFHIGFYPEPIKYEGVLYSGLTQPWESWIKIHYSTNADLTKTALVHELGHVISWVLLGRDSDPEHRDAEIWTWVDITNLTLIDALETTNCLAWE